MNFVQKWIHQRAIAEMNTYFHPLPLWPWRSSTYGMMIFYGQIFSENVSERLDDSTTYPPIQIRGPM